MVKNKYFIKSVAVLMAMSLLISSCASNTMIQTNADEADLYLNGEKVGKTPYKHRDTKIVGRTTEVRLEKEGYESYQ